MGRSRNGTRRGVLSRFRRAKMETDCGVTERKRFLSFRIVNSEYVSAFLTRREKINSSEYNWNMCVVPCITSNWRDRFIRAEIHYESFAAKCLVNRLSTRRSKINPNGIKEDGLYRRRNRKLSLDPSITST